MLNPNRIPVPSARTALIAAIAGGIGLMASSVIPSCDPILQHHTTISVPKADVFSIHPVGIDFRAVEAAHIIDSASQTFSTRFDKTPVVGFFTGIAERTMQNKSIFTGFDTPTKTASSTSSTSKVVETNPGGEVDTLVGALAADITVQPQPDGGETITIPTSNVVEFSAINEAKSNVVRDDGAGSVIGSGVWQITGGIFPGMKMKVETGRAVLDAVSRAEAINIAQTSCANSAWPVAEQAITEEYKIIGEQQYKDEKKIDPNLGTFNPNLVKVEFVGGEPNWEAPYQLPAHTKITSKVNCTVDPNAFKAITSDGGYVDAAQQPVPTSINAYNF